MAEAIVVACSECKKKFKPKTDVRGKKIRCPFCKEAFVVPAGPAAKNKAAPVKDGKAKVEEPKEVAAPPTPPAAEEKKAATSDDLDADPNPYGVTTVALVARCPNCTQEMGPNDIICLACGYNTVLRTWGATKKTIGVTTGQHVLYLLPALGAAGFLFFSIIFLMYYSVVSPYHVYDIPILNYSDHESIRMWTTVIFLGWLWGTGLFCFKKFIEKPIPDEEVVE